MALGNYHQLQDALDVGLLKKCHFGDSANGRRPAKASVILAFRPILVETPK